MTLDELLRTLATLIDEHDLADDDPGEGNYSCEACRKCNHCRFCVACDSCEDCTYCEECIDCTSCTQSKRCIGCEKVSYCEDCRDCEASRYLTLCVECTDCVHCLACVGLQGAEFYVLNEKRSRKEYFALLRQVQELMQARMQLGWRPPPIGLVSEVDERELGDPPLSAAPWLAELAAALAPPSPSPAPADPHAASERWAGGSGPSGLGREQPWREDRYEPHEHGGDAGYEAKRTDPGRYPDEARYPGGYPARGREPEPRRSDDLDELLRRPPSFVREPGYADRDADRYSEHAWADARGREADAWSERPPADEPWLEDSHAGTRARGREGGASLTGPRRPSRPGDASLREPAAPASFDEREPASPWLDEHERDEPREAPRTSLRRAGRPRRPTADGDAGSGEATGSGRGASESTQTTTGSGLRLGRKPKRSSR